MWKYSIGFFLVSLGFMLVHFVATLVTWYKKARPFKYSIIFSGYIVGILWLTATVLTPSLSGLTIFQSIQINPVPKNSTASPWPYAAVIRSTVSSQLYTGEYASVMPTPLEHTVEWRHSLPLGPADNPLVLDRVVPYMANDGLMELCDSIGNDPSWPQVNFTTQKAGLMVQRSSCDVVQNGVLAQAMGYSAVLVNDTTPSMNHWWKPYGETGEIPRYWVYPSLKIPVVVIQSDTAKLLVNDTNVKIEMYHLYGEAKEEEESVGGWIGVNPPVSFVLVVAPLYFCLVLFLWQHVSWIIYK
jgi:hypothetical protein